MLLFSLFFHTILSLPQCILSPLISLHNCTQFCSIKYSNSNPQKLFYNSTSQVCQPKIACHYGYLYVITNNTCISNIINIKVDGIIITNDLIQQKWSCYNGIFNMNMSKCICNEGWISSNDKIQLMDLTYVNLGCDVLKYVGAQKSQGQLLLDNQTISKRWQYIQDMYGEPIILNSFTVFNIFIYVIIMLISLVNYCLGNKL